MFVLLWNLLIALTPVSYQAVNLSKQSQATRLMMQRQRAILSGLWIHKDFTLDLNANGHYSLIQKSIPQKKLGYWWIQTIPSQDVNLRVCFSNQMHVQCQLITLDHRHKTLSFVLSNTKKHKMTLVLTKHK